MINHNTANPEQFVLPKERHVAKWLTVGVGSAALVALAANGLQSDPKFDMKNKAQLAVPAVAEYSSNTDEEYAGPIAHETIEQDEITGLVVERETREFAETYNITLQDKQSEADFLSAKGIDETVRQLTGGTVQPGMVIETRLDHGTGMIVSTYAPDKSE